MVETIGLIGIGAMGKGMLKNLLQKGYQVYAYDAEQTSIDWAVQQGAIPVSSPREIGQAAQVIFTSLPGPSIVRQVLAGEDGVFSSLSSGSYLIDTSTTDPETARDLYRLARERGAHFFDCPVSGGPAGADSGALTIMVGGDEEQLPTARPYLEAIGQEIVYLGESGSGQVAKLCHNAVVATITIALGEAFTVAKKAGVEPSKLAEVIDKGSGHNRVLSIFGPNILNGTYEEVKFRLEHMHKDLSLYVGTATYCTVPALMGSVTYQFYEAAKAQGKGTLDSSAVCEVIQSLANH
ncbi:NAD(P)-dependent oxidoreductase [Brevibacillus humidisoli]|uniref:NAD(P)-dependent oxidoreductase n=1 Tax=Brevibacillus humidisoli TaxID=2895522 RepID=UPI001E4BC90D|nr:NAD(P)-dependent oxidoreductase [Brevibacillus humidisoli]UFJ39364.1 NAD(P)-dependent oxidoreductase [Brevibacillus humidisoli]